MFIVRKSVERRRVYVMKWSSKLIDGNSLTLGVCYYPEHWPDTMWAADLERMQECGIQVVRIAEFSWNLTEPTEGIFTYDFYDRFLDLCQEKGMKVIFGTPTATPPAWLTKRYPEVLNAFPDGTRLEHGGRRHYNYNSKVYREKTAIIVERLAAHYSPHPCIMTKPRADLLEKYVENGGTLILGCRSE